MPGYFAILTLALMIGTVLTRVAMMRQKGIKAMKFGQMDKTDFLIPPFALLYFYLVFAAAGILPTGSKVRVSRPPDDLAARFNRRLPPQARLDSGVDMPFAVKCP